MIVFPKFGRGGW